MRTLREGGIPSGMAGDAPPGRRPRAATTTGGSVRAQFRRFDPTFVLLLRSRIGRRLYHPSQVTVEALPSLTALAEPPPPWTSPLDTLIRTVDPSIEFHGTTRCSRAYKFLP
jgi:hypothetical protein